MTDLKQMLQSIQDDDEISDDGVIVYADSVKQALMLASEDLNIDVSQLDYDIIEKGVKGFFGFGRKPYRVQIQPIKIEDEYEDIHEIERKLTKEPELDEIELKQIEKDIDGECRIRVTKSGIWLTVTPPRGRGERVTLEEVLSQLNQLRIGDADRKKIEKKLKNPSLKPIKIGDWTPNLEYDGTLTVEVSEDEMKAYVHFAPPRYSGRHMELDDVIDSLTPASVVAGINEERISEYLEKMDYNKSLLAAEGIPPKHGNDAYIDYKVRVFKSHVAFEEDERGQVDFRNLDLLENVVVGQLLAVKVPAEEGISGKTVTNRVIPARSGKDIVMKHGKGTILTEDGLELTAEINGQVVFQFDKISVEPVYSVKGDVSLETGNIVFLGSVIVSGSVQDNFIVKAAGNVEIKGTVQKAFIEAEGDIIVRQGIVGREKARIESTGGCVYAKYIQTANIIAEKDIIVSEGIIHSNIDAGERILCFGKRAKIVGGVIRAGKEVNARYLGADSFTKTEVSVGINPKVLQQMSELRRISKEINEELKKLKLDMNTLVVQKKNSGGYLPPDKEELSKKLLNQKQKLTGRLNEIVLELDELRAYISMLGQNGKVCVEKSVYPGVDIFMKDEKFSVKDPYNYIKFTMEDSGIRLSEYEPPVMDEKQKRMLSMSRSR
ncbi:MAG: FapA family protein [Spirochaetota bacterium]|nr:FapA family protein [Spirochaetota bacterium]